jgi:hypothetical protein
VGNVLRFELRPRAVVCEGCSQVFVTREVPPHCCDACSIAAFDAEMADLDRKARERGFASFEEWVAAEFSRSHDHADVA